jgi:serine/threonine-protein kinase
MPPPANLAHYRITSKLGEGGMGEVWRATDTKLNRDVAVKILPESYSQDPDRMARFIREAQVLAGLNHPNIAAIYGVEERALILELVEGPTLADRIEQGRMPFDEALPLIRQLIEAIDYAHQKGVIHRDLKPANIKITPDGKLKVLDFGLAKALSGQAQTAPSAIGNSPTLTLAAGTVAGVILGTASYMAPEQARGKTVDKRADIWAFGVVVYELLTGCHLFAGAWIATRRRACAISAMPWISSLPPTPRRALPWLQNARPGGSPPRSRRSCWPASSPCSGSAPQPDATRHSSCE